MAILLTQPRFQVWKEANGAARSCTSNRNCPTTHYCTPVTTWTGTVYQTKPLCCPSKNYVCSQPRDVGIRCSSTRITRWFFNPDTKNCQTFEYNGCEGLFCFLMMDTVGDNFVLGKFDRKKAGKVQGNRQIFYVIV